MTLYVILGLLALASGAVAAYYRYRALRAEEALGVLKNIGAEWKASNEALQDRIRRAEAVLEERHQKERAEDAATQERARGDADLAVDLLNSLHPDGGAGDGQAPGLQPGRPDPVPAGPGRKVSRR